MTTDTKKAENIMTPEFRVSYPSVFKAKLNELSKKMEFSLVALFKKGENLDALKKEAERAVIARWGSDKTKWPKNLRSPFRDQGERESDGYEAGAVFMNLKSSQRPGLVDGGNNDIINETDFYAGCYARATLRAYAYPKPGVTGQTPGVAFGLQNIQKLRDGESLSGRMKAQDEFEPVADAEVSAGGDAGSLFG
jgi:hypothetical protein